MNTAENLEKPDELEIPEWTTCVISGPHINSINVTWFAMHGCTIGKGASAITMIKAQGATDNNTIDTGLRKLREHFGEEFEILFY